MSSDVIERRTKALLSTMREVCIGIDQEDCNFTTILASINGLHFPVNWSQQQSRLQAQRETTTTTPRYTSCPFDI